MLGRKTAYRDVVNRNIVCGLNEQNLEKAFFAHPTAFDVTVTLLLIKHDIIDNNKVRGSSASTDCKNGS